MQQSYSWWFAVQGHGRNYWQRSHCMVVDCLLAEAWKIAQGRTPENRTQPVVSLIRNHAGAQHCTGIQQALERRRVQFRAEHTTKKKNSSSLFLTDSFSFYPTVILVEFNAHSFTGKAPKASVFNCHHLNIITSKLDSLLNQLLRSILHIVLYSVHASHADVILQLTKANQS